MKLGELIDMARKYGLNPDAELMVRPLLKDRSRKVTNIEVGTPGEILLTCSRPSENKKPRTSPVSRKR